MISPILLLHPEMLADCQRARDVYAEAAPVDLRGESPQASENVFPSSDIRSLRPQGRQPILMTMNCLNGYFHFPYFDSLAEAFVKAEGKGAVAAFSPSGLSLNGPAHLYQQALIDELTSSRHSRLGDAVLAAQRTYAESGAFPERLSSGALPLEQTLRVGAQIADTLGKTHRAGIVHRDVKPCNVMLTKSGPKLLDFGLARLEEPVRFDSRSMLPTQAKPVGAAPAPAAQRKCSVSTPARFAAVCESSA